MPYYIQKHNIKSIINLRGPPRDDWYNQEQAIAEKYNIKHFNFKIGDRKIQTMDKMVELINKAGADRASLAAALYLYKIKNKENAQEAISIKYGHFPWLGSKTFAMDKSFKNFVKHYSKL